MGRAIRYRYDAAGRVTVREQPDGSEIRYDYDARGNPVALQAPSGATHTIAYSPLDLVESYGSPGGGAYGYSYNRSQQLTRIMPPDGQALELEYDPGGRLAKLAWPGGQVAYEHDPATGQAKTITRTGGGTLTVAHDGPLLTETSWAGEITGAVRRTYDDDFRVRSLAVGDADPIALAYDDDGALATAGDLTLTRDPLNNLLTGTTLGGVEETFEHNGFGEVVAHQVRHGGAGLFAARYIRDALGRVTQKTETVGGATSVHDYGYDPAGRLAEVKENGATVAAYDYDKNGNHITATADGVTIAATYDAQDRLIQYGDAAYTFDTSGELQSRTVGDGVTTYEYDVLGNLLRVDLPTGSAVTYLVDGLNRRIGRKVDGTLVQASFTTARSRSRS